MINCNEVEHFFKLLLQESLPEITTFQEWDSNPQPTGFLLIKKQSQARHEITLKQVWEDVWIDLKVDQTYF